MTYSTDYRKILKKFYCYCQIVLYSCFMHGFYQNCTAVFQIALLNV